MQQLNKLICISGQHLRAALGWSLCNKRNLRWELAAALTAESSVLAQLTTVITSVDTSHLVWRPVAHRNQYPALPICLKLHHYDNSSLTTSPSACFFSYLLSPAQLHLRYNVTASHATTAETHKRSIVAGKKTKKQKHLDLDSCVFAPPLLTKIKLSNSEQLCFLLLWRKCLHH